MVDTIAPTTLDKFINSSLQAVNPTNWPAAPIKFFSNGTPTSFATNQGTGGAATLTGSLSAASSNPPSASGYSAQGVHFAGSNQGFGPTRLLISSLAATDNGLYSFSFWAKGLVTIANAGSTAWVHDQASNDSPLLGVISIGGELFQLIFAPNAGGEFDAAVTPTALDPTKWNHILFSSDFTSSTPHFALYVNRSLVSYSSVQGTGNFYALAATSSPITNQINGRTFAFGDDSTLIDGVDCDFADVWIGAGISLLGAGKGAISSPHKGDKRRRVDINILRSILRDAGSPWAAELAKCDVCWGKLQHLGGDDYYCCACDERIQAVRAQEADNQYNDSRNTASQRLKIPRCIMNAPCDCGELCEDEEKYGWLVGKG